MMSKSEFMSTLRVGALAVLVPLAACDDSTPAEGNATEAGAADPRIEYIGPGATALAPRPATGEMHPEPRRKETMPDARKAFEEVMDLVGANYVDGPMPEDEMWTAATEGVLSRLIQIEGAHINTLMSPRDLEELRIGTEGQLVGVGVMIELVADVVLVREVIPGGPAAAAGIHSGDRILGIDGQRIKGQPLIDIVDKIRGPEGSKVSLFVQRDTEEWDAELTRDRIEYSSVDGTMLEGGVGYLRITQFSKSTGTDVDAKLRELETAGMTSLVLDVRDCPGGLLESSLEVSELFLPPNSTIMSVSGPKSGDKTMTTERTDRWESLPIVALVGPFTASGAEILTAALQHHGRARIVGGRTMGKGTVEAIHELSNGWGLKLSVSRFSSAAGEPMLGRGVSPDIEMTQDRMAKPTRVPVDELQPATDPQLAAAVSLAR